MHLFWRGADQMCGDSVKQRGPVGRARGLVSVVQVEQMRVWSTRFARLPSQHSRDSSRASGLSET